LLRNHPGPDAYTSFEATYLVWTDLTLDLAAAKTSVSGFDPSDIRQIGVQFATGDPYEGGSFTSATNVLHIDWITLQ